jgi:hypothetical protein
MTPAWTAFLMTNAFGAPRRDGLLQRVTKPPSITNSVPVT